MGSRERDLVLLVPSRGRPANVQRLNETCKRTCTARTLLHFGFDDDDPAREQNIKAAEGCSWTSRERMNLTGWTNKLAVMNMELAPALASIGDDMVPETPGWDTALLDALPAGGGAAYAHSNRRDDIPEHIVISTSLVAALGRFALFGGHWYIDEGWRDVFGPSGAGCLAFVPDVTIRHLHPNVPGGDPADRTYHDAAEEFDADLATYQRWRLSPRGMAADIDTVRRARAGSPGSPGTARDDPAALGDRPGAVPARADGPGAAAHR